MWVCPFFWVSLINSVSNFSNGELSNWTSLFIHSKQSLSSCTASNSSAQIPVLTPVAIKSKLIAFCGEVKPLSFFKELRIVRNISAWSKLQNSLNLVLNPVQLMLSISSNSTLVSSTSLVGITSNLLFLIPLHSQLVIQPCITSWIYLLAFNSRCLWVNQSMHREITHRLDAVEQFL